MVGTVDFRYRRQGVCLVSRGTLRKASDEACCYLNSELPARLWGNARVCFSVVFVTGLDVYPRNINQEIQHFIDCLLQD